MYKTDYRKIHETRYQKLRRQCAENLTITEESIKDVVAMVNFCMSRNWIQKGAKLLEVGCGRGGHSIALAQEGFDVVGIDISPTAIEWAKERAQEKNIHVNFQVGNVLELPFDKEQFDFVLDANCFNCIAEDDRKIYLHEVYRALKLGGMTLFICKSTTISQYVMIDGVRGRYLGAPQDIKEELVSAGFKVLHSELETVEKTGYFNMMNIFARKKKKDEYMESE